MQQVRQLRGAGFQSLQKECSIRQLVLIRRLRKQLQTLFIRVGFRRSIEMEVKVGKGFQVRERQAEARQVPASGRVTQNNMGQFVRQHCGQSRLIGEHVEKPAAKNDSSANHERLQG